MKNVSFILWKTVTDFSANPMQSSLTRKNIAKVTYTCQTLKSVSRLVSNHKVGVGGES